MTSTHPFADGDSFFGQRLRVGHIVLHNGLEQLIFILPIKWRLRVEKTVNKECFILSQIRMNES